MAKISTSMLNRIVEGIHGSSDPYIRAGEMSSDAIRQGTQANVQMLNRAMNKLQDYFGKSAGYLNPFLRAGKDAMGNYMQTLTPGGLDAMLGEIMGSNAFQSLVGERQRAAEGALSAGGLMRSGEAAPAAAAIPTDLAFQIENMLAGRNAGMVDTGFQAALGKGDIFSSLATNIAQLMGQGGAIMQQGIQGSADTLAEALMASASAKAAERSGDKDRKSNLLGSAMSMIGGIFSDPGLKENLTPIGEIGGLTLYSWDWKDECSDYVKDFPTVGFLSTDVKAMHPDLVGEFGSYDTVDMKGLLERIQ